MPNFAVVNAVVHHYIYRPAVAGPTLIFLNSLGSDLRIWQAVTARLPQHYGVLCYDQRGHGLSDAPPGPCSLSTLAADLLGLMGQLAIERAVLVGVSVGGMIAQQFALTYPERVTALVLCDTGAKIGTAAYWTERATAVRTHGMEPLTETILARWFSAEFAMHQPAAYRGYANMLGRTPAEGYAATCEALRDADLREVVSTIDVPTLVLCGDEDLATPPSLGQTLAAAIPNAHFVLVEKAGHIPSIEQPETLSLQIVCFLEKIANDRAEVH